jgi:flagellar biosynthesis/type III secretory pathway chaperone
MKSTDITIEEKINELMDCLDKDCQHIQETLTQLNKLRELIIKRDDAALGKMLETVQAKSQDYRKNESNRQSIRAELANALGYPIEQLTLSTLEKSLHETTGIKITERKKRLKSLIEELRKEHLSTALLLSECARFNNLLLKKIFNLGKTEVVCYDSKGETKRQTDTAFVNLQF